MYQVNEVGVNLVEIGIDIARSVLAPRIALAFLLRFIEVPILARVDEDHMAVFRGLDELRHTALLGQLGTGHHAKRNTGLHVAAHVVDRAGPGAVTGHARNDLGLLFVSLWYSGFRFNHPGFR